MIPAVALRAALALTDVLHALSAGAVGFTRGLNDTPKIAGLLLVSTTHVSCGALVGLGVASGEARWRMFGAIAGAWVVTLPLAAGFSAIAAGALRALA
jgi:phosphate/sulfate permease